MIKDNPGLYVLSISPFLINSFDLITILYFLYLLFSHLFLEFESTKVLLLMYGDSEVRRGNDSTISSS